MSSLDSRGICIKWRLRQDLVQKEPPLDAGGKARRDSGDVLGRIGAVRYGEGVTAPLTTNGLTPAADFPSEPYEAVHRLVAATWADHELYEHYAGAWNAVAYRFHGAIHAGEEFDRSLAAEGSTPTPAQRYRQDQALAEFFGSGYSTFESIFYSLHTVGAFIDPASFSLATPKARQQVSPSLTATAFKRAFPGDPLLAAVDAFFSDPAYQEWREIRNILTHRTAPGRRMYVGIGSDDAPATEWKLNNIPMDATLVPARRAALAGAVGALLTAVEAFVAGKVRAQI